MAKNSDSGRAETAVGDKACKVVRIRLDQIVSVAAPDELAWTNHLGFAGEQLPAVRAEALPILQLLSPMVICLQETPGSDSDTYRLVAGRRTYQLHAEQLSGSASITAIELATAVSDADAAEMAHIDTLLLRTLWVPDERARDIVAAALQEPEVSGALGRFVRIGGREEVARLLGMSRATLHRRSQDGRAGLAAIRKPPARGSAPLAILDDPSDPMGD